MFDASAADTLFICVVLSLNKNEIDGAFQARLEIEGGLQVGRADPAGPGCPASWLALALAVLGSQAALGRPNI